MHKTLRSGLILLLMIPALAIIPACAKKATTVEKGPGTVADQAGIDRQKELEADRKRQEAEQRQFQAAKRQFMSEDIYFQRGSYQLQPQARTILYRKAEFMKKYPDVMVIIEGHTDERGTRETNIAFGDRRAGEVKSFLIREGIERERLIPVSFGKERPVAAGKSEAARAKNRRVHFVVKE
ncbi:MAG: OmpA family protein [Desulfobacterales bacterium]|jgi:peptidoglycan-associated lipoprotein